MTRPIRASMVVARLQLRAPEARSLLLAAPTSDIELSGLGRDLMRAANEAQLQPRLLAVDADPGSDFETVSSSDLATPARARARLEGHDGLTLVIGRGVLDSSGTLIAASAVDGVLMVAKTGKTARNQLADARDEVERAGGRLVGALVL